MAESILKLKSYPFAIQIVKVSQSLIGEKKEYVMSKQLIRSGTAIGALIREAEFAQSNKMSISIKETNETLYWIDLLKDTDYIDLKNHIVIASDCKELIAILVSSIKTTKSRFVI